MILITCESNCSEVVEFVKNKLSSLGIAIRVLDGREKGWVGFCYEKCWDPDEDSGDVECEHDVIKKNYSALIKVVEEAAEKFGERLFYIFITPAPSLNLWGVTVVDIMYTTWISRNVPKNVLDPKLYKTFVLNVITKLDPILASQLNSIPFISIDDVAAELRAKGVNVKGVNNGYLFRVDLNDNLS